jgi:hypothetical protein
MRRLFGVIAAHCPHCDKKVFTTGVGFGRHCPECNKFFDACPSGLFEEHTCQDLQKVKLPTSQD